MQQVSLGFADETVSGNTRDCNTFLFRDVVTSRAGRSIVVYGQRQILDLHVAHCPLNSDSWWMATVSGWHCWAYLTICLPLFTLTKFALLWRTFSGDVLRFVGLRFVPATGSRDLWVGSFVREYRAIQHVPLVCTVSTAVLGVRAEREVLAWLEAFLVVLIGLLAPSTWTLNEVRIASLQRSFDVADQSFRRCGRESHWLLLIELDAETTAIDAIISACFLIFRFRTKPLGPLTEVAFMMS
jgi:hypothetical protein